MNDPKRGMAKVTCPIFEAMGQIPVFHRTYFLFLTNNSNNYNNNNNNNWLSSHGRMKSHWHVTVATTLADSYVNAPANSAGAAAKWTASRKSAKYVDLPASYIFQPIALETLGPMNSSAMEFFTVLGRKIGVSWGDDREGRLLLCPPIMTPVSVINIIIIIINCFKLLIIIIILLILLLYQDNNYKIL